MMCLRNIMTNGDDRIFDAELITAQTATWLSELGLSSIERDSDRAIGFVSNM